MTHRLRVAALACLLASAPAWADSGFRGEFDLDASAAGNRSDSLDAALGERNHVDQDVKLRLMWTGSLGGAWGLDLAWLGQAYHGGGTALDRAAYGSGLYVDPDRTALLRLNHSFSDHGDTFAEQRLDRLALTYSGSHLVVRLGRQALTWGSGLVFHPMDLFNPFPPDATFTTYKPGADMVYGQWLFDNGADLQAVAVPRRDPASGRLAAGQSSAGLKWHGFVGNQTGLDLLLARDYGADVLGLGISGDLGGANWSIEAVPTRLAGGGLRTSLLANGQYAWTWAKRNVTGYLEWFRNGFGVSGRDHALTDLPPPLADRLARGELFTVSRDYLSAGLEVQWTPLLTLKPSLIANLDDGSALFLAQAVYSLSQNTSLTAGLQWGVGGRRTEYGGGLETAPGSGVFYAPARRAYARLSWYFQ